MEEAGVANKKSKKVRGRPFEKGQVANPAGRPKGSSNKMSINALIDAIHKVEEEKGQTFLEAWIESAWNDPKAMEGIAKKTLPDKILIGSMEEEVKRMTDEEVDGRIRQLETERTAPCVAQGTA